LRNASNVAWIAAIPVPNAAQSAPPSRMASFFSRARTVGLPLREYEYPLERYSSTEGWT
jgi:hypothetical protein